MQGSGQNAAVKQPTNTLDEPSGTGGTNSLIVRTSLASYLAGTSHETSVPVTQGKER